MNSKKILIILSVVLIGMAAFYGGMRLDEKWYARDSKTQEPAIVNQVENLDEAASISSTETIEMVEDKKEEVVNTDAETDIFDIDESRLASSPNLPFSENLISYITIPSKRPLRTESITDEIYELYNGKENEKLTESLDAWVNKDTVIYETSWADAIDRYKNGEDFFVFCSATWCPYCNAQIGAITDAAVKTNTPIYYIDIDKSPRSTYQTEKGYITSRQINYDFENFMKTLGVEKFPEKTLMGENEEWVECGLKTVYVPDLIHINKDVVERFMYPSGYDDSDGMQQEEIEIFTNAVVEFFEK